MYEAAEQRIKEVSKQMGINLDEEKVFSIAIMLSEFDNYDDDLSDERVRDAIGFIGIEEHEYE